MKAFILTESIRSAFASILAVLNWISALLALTMIGVGWFIQSKVAEYTNLVSHYHHNNTAAHVMMFIGAVTAATNFSGGLVMFMVQNPLKRREFRIFLISYIIMSIIVTILVMCGGVMCFVTIQGLERTFHGGIANAMKKYSDHQHLKTELDQLQMFYFCCGNDAYSDWFTVQWLSPSFMTKVQAAKKTQDEVPFSCCSVHAHRPCIHHSVHDNKAHLNYDHEKQVTLYKSGCRKALMSYFEDLLTKCGLLNIVVLVLQVGMVVMARYLQTSLDMTFKTPDVLSPSVGYVLQDKALGSKSPKRESLSSKQIGYNQILADTYFESTATSTLKKKLVNSDDAIYQSLPSSSNDTMGTMFTEKYSLQ